MLFRALLYRAMRFSTFTRHSLFSPFYVYATLFHDVTGTFLPPTMIVDFAPLYVCQTMPLPPSADARSAPRLLTSACFAARRMLRLHEACRAAMPRLRA